jgi:ankyrin repeat protein
MSSYKGFQLRNAAAEHDLAQIKTILANGDVDINIQSLAGGTVLHVIVCSDTSDGTDCMKYLLENKADPNVRNLYGIEAIHDAARHGKHKLIQLLLEYKASVDHRDNEGYTPLAHCLSEARNPNSVKLLLAAGADPNTVFAMKEFLNYSVFYGMDPVIAHMLLDAGAKWQYCTYNARLMDIVDARKRVKRNAFLLYGIMKKRFGSYHDVANMVAAAVWGTRQSEGW